MDNSVVSLDIQEIEASLTTLGRKMYYLRLFQDGIDVKLDPKPSSSLHWLVPSGAPKHPRRRSPVILEIYIKRRWPLADKKISRRVSINYDDVLKLRSDPEQTSLTVQLDAPECVLSIKVAVSTAAEVLPDATEVLNRVRIQRPDGQPVLDALGKYRPVVESLVTMAGLAVEADSRAKAVFTPLQWAYDKLLQEENRNALTWKLFDKMDRTLPYVGNVIAELTEELAEPKELQSAAIELLELIKGASDFIAKYQNDGLPVRALSSIFCSSADEEVNALVDLFDLSKADFDCALKVETLLTLWRRDKTNSLNRLEAKTYAASPADPNCVCMYSTRREILAEISQWAADKTSSSNLLWIYGVVGSGKSSIMWSSAKEFRRQSRLGASFFFDRDTPELVDAKCVLPTLAFLLARQEELFKTAVVEAIGDETSILRIPIQDQFNRFIKPPLQKLSNHTLTTGPLIIFIDGLDQCASVEECGRLLHCLLQISTLTKWLKVIVASRPYAYIQEALPGCRRLEIDHTDDNTRRDIAIVTKKLLEEIPEEKRPPGWPHTDAIQRLVERSCGLFAWTSIACSFISGGEEPQERLDAVMSSHNNLHSNIREVYCTRDDFYKELYRRLYETILEKSLGPGSDNAKRYRNIIGTVIALQTPLPAWGLHAFLDKSDSSQLEQRLERLRSVVYQDRLNGAIRVCHPSFRDFFEDKHCPEQFSIDFQEMHTTLAEKCLEIMFSGLHYDMCQLASWHRFNHEVIDLDGVHDAIGVPLRYSCVHWAAHLRDSEDQRAMMELLRRFFYGESLLFWIEALSLVEKLQTAPTALCLAEKYNQQSRFRDSDGDLSIAIYDAYRFILAFSKPISESTLHLYVSALQFAPTNSKILNIENVSFNPSVRIRKEDWWSPVLHSHRRRHGPVSSVSFSPDGQYIASGESDHVIQIWEAQTFTPIKTFEGHTDTISCITFSPDALFVISGSHDNTTRVWDIEKGLVTTLGESEDWVLCVSCWREGSIRRIASGYRDAKILIWTYVNEEIKPKLQTISNGTHAVCCVSFSADGTQLASGSEDGIIRIWSLDSRFPKAKNAPKKHADSVLSITFMSTNRTVISLSRDRLIMIWEIGDSNLKFIGGSNLPVSIPQSSNRELDGKVATSHPSDGTLLPDSDVPPDDPPSSGRSLGEMQTLPPIFKSLFSTETIERFREHEQFILCATLSATGSVMLASLEHGIQLWRAEQTSLVHRFTSGRMDPITSLALSFNGDHIVSGSADGTIRVWDVEASHRHDAQISEATNTPPERSTLLSDDWNVPRLLTSGWIVDDEDNLLLWVPDEYRMCISEIIT